MFFCFCYSSMCGAIFLFGISPQHFKYCDTSVHSWAIFGDMEHWWKSNHCLIHHDGNGNPGNDGKPHISPYPQLLHFFLSPISNFLSSFSPQTVLSFTFFISIRNKGHACLVCGVKRRMCDALLPACLAQSNLPQTSNIIIHGTCIFLTLEFH